MVDGHSSLILKGFAKNGSVIAGVGGVSALSPWLGALAIIAIILCKALDKAPDIIRACKEPNLSGVIRCEVGATCRSRLLQSKSDKATPDAF